MGLHCHTGPFAKYMSGFLADDLGTRDCHHSYGDSRGSEYKLSQVSPGNSTMIFLNNLLEEGDLYSNK